MSKMSKMNKGELSAHEFRAAAAAAAAAAADVAEVWRGPKPREFAARRATIHTSWRAARRAARSLASGREPRLSRVL